MKKPTSKPDNGLQTAAYFIQLGIEQYRQSPALRRQTQISLLDLEQAGKIRRKLLRQVDKGN